MFHADLPPEFWERIGKQIAQSDAFHPETIDYVVHAFEKRSWTLVKMPLSSALCGRKWLDAFPKK